MSNDQPLHPSDEELAEAYSRGLDWESGFSEARKKYYQDAFLAGLATGRNKAAAIVECKDREISAFREELYTLKNEIESWKNTHRLDRMTINRAHKIIRDSE